MTLLLVRLGVLLVVIKCVRSVWHHPERLKRIETRAGYDTALVTTCCREGCLCAHEKAYVFPRATVRQGDKRRFL